MTWAAGAGNKYHANGPFELAMARSLVGGTEDIHVHGYNPAVGTTMETLWADSGLKTYLGAAVAMTISSSDTDDTIAGAGAQKVDILYLDDDWAVQLLEDVEMNGQTGVATTSILRVLDIIVRQTGASLLNEGTIYIGTGTITTGKPAVVHAAMAPFFNRLFGGCWTVPAGKNGIIAPIGGGVGEGKTTNWFLTTRDFGEDTFHPHHHELLFQRNFNEALWEMFPEKTDLELRGFNDVASQAVTGHFNLILIDK